MDTDGEFRTFRTIFPGLQGADFRITSPRTRFYNCIAWAAGDTSRWWWPVSSRPSYWPQSAVRVLTLQAFREAFSTLGYLESDYAEQDEGFEKIAIFANGNDIPAHAARQLASGRWTSKLGRAEDIEHELRDLEGAVCGSVVLVMKRPSTGAT